MKRTSGGRSARAVVSDSTKEEDEEAEARRPENLILVRESAVGREALWKMAQQTLEKHPDIPGTVAALKAGISAYTHPEDYGGRRVGRGDTTGALFPIEGTWFLYIQGSAATEEREETQRAHRAENAFVEVLKETLSSLQPRRLVAAKFSRFVRSHQYAYDLFPYVVRYVDSVVVDEMPEFDPASEAGAHMWAMGTSWAAYERRAILTRTTIGKMLDARKGKWILAPSAIPFGYELLADKTVAPDLSLKAAVRRMMEIVSEPHQTSVQILDLLDEAGVISPWIVKHGNRTGSLGDIINPRGYLAALRNRFSVYRTGLYVFRHRNPLPGVKEYGGVQVQGRRGENGYLEVVYDLGLPPGGWVEEALLDAAEASFVMTEARPIGQHRNGKPLLGLVRYVEGDTEMRLMSDADNYVLRARPYDGSSDVGPAIPAPPGRGWSDERTMKKDGVRVASMRTADLHKSIATTIMDRFRHGAWARRVDALEQVRGLDRTCTVDARTNRLASLDRRIIEARKELSAAHRLVKAVAGTTVEDASLKEIVLKDAATSGRKVDELVRERDELDRQAYAPMDFGDGFESEASYITQALANLEVADQLHTPSLARMLVEILREFRMEADGYEVRWSCVVLIPANRVHLQIRAEGVVPNIYRTRGAVAFDRVGPRLERFMVTGDTLREVMRSNFSKHGGNSLGVPLKQRLVEMGVAPDAARLLIIVGVSDLRRAVWAKLQGQEFPDDLDAEWAAHVARVYLDPDFSWPCPRWSVNVLGRRRAIELLLEKGGSASLDSLAKHQSKGSLVTYSKDSVSKQLDKGILPPSLTRYGDWLSASPNGRGVALIDCPHGDCDGRCTVALWVPETAFGLEEPANVICPTCRRLPVKGSPVFPEAYLHLARGSAGPNPSAADAGAE